ncbi:uncharacterized protein LOC134672773 [Cydia fagiglandana]|uniref:uncharacterized protein LOC134672773 n=1 Tax=Cydia fagiglandana TaxID=1458189 RepID=UPI002FEE140F
MWFISLLVGYASGVMLTHDCPYGENYKSCMFYEEYTCWTSNDHKVRSRTPAKRLDHCWGGCVCKHETVRAYPDGPCVAAYSCRDQYFMKTLAKLPMDFVYFR